MKIDTSRQVAPKRILICSCRCLFSQGVEAFLLNNPELSVTGWETDPDKALLRIKETRPDAILVITEPPFDAWLNTLFIESVGATIITLKLQEDIVRVFRSQHYIAQDMANLARIIKHSATMMPDLMS